MRSLFVMVAVSAWLLVGEPARAADDQPAARPVIGLALSGGGARGGAHLGVLKVLEEMRVPVDVIVGTSAGSIVGAAYASGLPVEAIEEEMQAINTAELFRDVVRLDQPYRHKQDDRNNYIGPEIGVHANGVLLPKGAVSGVSLEAKLRRLTRLAQTTNFDQLPVRFRAVATDVTTSQMVVISHGSLSTAIRASMAVPAAVNPVEIDGRLLVDGGVSRNLPVDVARSLGADIVIAVNIGTPLLKREEITSLVSVSEQMLRILTDANVQRSVAELTARDILVSPELGTLGSADFNRLPEAVQAGEVAARALASRFAPLALPPDDYVALAERRARAYVEHHAVIDEVRVVGTRTVNPEVVAAALQTTAGQPFDPKVADADMKRVYARGDFEGVTYTLNDEPGIGTVLVVDATEKSWGPNYLRFGLGLSSDFEGNNFFRLLASHRWTWLNSLGAEWRNDFQIGHTDFLRSEWYQPLTPRQRLFIAPRFEAIREPFDAYDEEGTRLARFRRQWVGGGLDVGLPLGNAGEIRLGASRGKVKVLTDTSFLPGNLIIPDADTGGVIGRFGFDTLDNRHFPREGMAASVSLYAARRGMGASDSYNKATGSLDAAVAHGKHSLSLGLRGGGRLGGGSLPDYELFSLGGFWQLSGYKTGQLLGTEFSFARVIYSYRITAPGFFDGTYFGVSAEAGRISDLNSSPGYDRLRHGYSAYVALDTLLGPAYFAVGVNSDGKGAAYFFLGQPP